MRPARITQRACQTRDRRNRRDSPVLPITVVGTPTRACQRVTAMTTSDVVPCRVARHTRPGVRTFRCGCLLQLFGFVLAALVLAAAPAVAQDRLDAAAAALDRVTAQPKAEPTGVERTA